jgi:hypothetical protein
VTNTITARKTDPPNFSISVTDKSLSKAGVIILPEGGKSHTLTLKFFRNPIVIQYFRKKAELWYETAANTEKVHELRNGSLIFVWGVHLSPNTGMAILRLRAGKFAKSGHNCNFRPVSGHPREYQWDLSSSKGMQKKGWIATTSCATTGAHDVCYGVVGSCIFLDPETLANTGGGKIPPLPVVDGDEPVIESFISSLRVPRNSIIASILGSTTSESFHFE